jgi:hypothetical protein
MHIGVHKGSRSGVSTKGQNKEFILRRFNLKTIATSIAFGLIAILGTTELANAQGNRRMDERQERREMKQLQKANKAQARAEQQRIALEHQRQATWTRRNTQIANTRSGNDRSGGAGYYMGNANDNTNRDGRYRVYRNGSYYNTNCQGADLLRQAVNEGYRQGFRAGRSDRNGRRNVGWSNSNIYRSGTYGYQSYVNRSQYQYYFRQGFQRGYQDGSNSRYRDDYNGQYEYGYYENGSMNILGTILNSVLRIQSY